jgi:hypothetical protein
MSVQKCHNLVEWLDGVILLCEKGDGFYVPKLMDLKRYCKSKDHSSCPFYMKFTDLSSDMNVACLSRKVMNNEIHYK